MEKHKKCIVIFLIIIALLYLGVDITKAVKGESPIFFQRWRQIDMGYTKKMEIKSYLLTDDGAAYLLQNPQKEISQPMQSELYKKNINVVLRVKNLKRKIAWGTISYKIGEKRLFVDVINIEGESDKFNNFVISVGNIITSDEDKKPKSLDAKFKTLYTRDNL
ncbi:MAG: hypothetical protein K940chlam5_00263 [Candidatus Anoxychlamydiales bacterium]|nr:hypothetical protein [Candidatus Anoxychlamydiales bacterium]